MLHLQLLDRTSQAILDDIDASALVPQLQTILGVNVEERFPQVAIAAPESFALDDIISGLEMVDARLNSLAQREISEQPTDRPLSELSDEERANLPAHQNVTVEGIARVRYTQRVVEENTTYMPVQAQLDLLIAFLKQCRNQQSLLRNLAF